MRCCLISLGFPLSRSLSVFYLPECSALASSSLGLIFKFYELPFEKIKSSKIQQLWDAVLSVYDNYD